MAGLRQARKPGKPGVSGLARVASNIFSHYLYAWLFY